jgi:replication factor C subunit 1
MDEYYVSKDDWDTFVELGLGEFRDEVVLKRISTATKTAFTKKCELPHRLFACPDQRI